MKRVSLHIGLAAVALSCSNGHAQVSTRFQVAYLSDASRAQLVSKQVDEAGFGPALVESSGTGYRVLTKEFPSYAEANFVKQKVYDAGFAGAFAVSGQVSAVAQSASALQERAFDSLIVPSAADFNFVRIDFDKVKPEKGKRESVQEAAIFSSDSANRENDPANRKKVKESLPKGASLTISKEQLNDKIAAYHGTRLSDEAIADIDIYLSRFPASKDVQRMKILRAYWMVTGGRPQDAKNEFQSIAAAYPGTETAGEAALRVAFLTLKEPGGHIQALPLFRSIATGEVPAKPADRVEAMLRCAALYHKGKDLDAAVRLYQVVESQKSIPNEIQAFARLQRAGLLMEKAWNKTASFAECRDLAQDLLREFPKVHKQTRATAAVLILETYCHEQNYKRALVTSKEHESLWSGSPEAVVAYYWIAKANLETENVFAASDLIDAVINAKFDSSTRFRAVDINVSARKLASRIYEKQGNRAKAREILKD